jgi:hypothetical protein
VQDKRRWNNDRVELQEFQTKLKDIGKKQWMATGTRNKDAVFSGIESFHFLAHAFEVNIICIEEDSLFSFKPQALLVKYATSYLTSPLPYLSRTLPLLIAFLPYLCYTICMCVQVL